MAAKGKEKFFELEVTTPTYMDVTLTSTTSMTASSVKAGEKEVLKTALAGKWSSAPSGFAFDKIEFAGLGVPIVIENSLNNVVPDLKLEFKGDDQSKGELYGTYKIKPATVKGMVDLMNQRKVEVSAVGGHGAVTAGINALWSKTPADEKKKTAEKVDKDVQVSAGYKGPNFFAGLNATKFFQNYEVLASYSANKDVTVTGKVEVAPMDAKLSKIVAMNREWKGTLAAVYQCNPKTVLKAKIDTAKVLDLSVKQSFDKKFVVSAWAQQQFPMQSSTTFGLKAVIG